MTRKKIPETVEAEVMFKSNRECCVCDKKGDHIHHIDGDNSNNQIDNLALLCFDCHDEATKISSLKKKLNPKTITKFRDFKYQVIEAKRATALGVFNSPIDNLTTEELLDITKSAIIIIELEKIKEEYFDAEWDERSLILNKLKKFSNHSNFRVAYEVFSFLVLVADQSRSGIPTEVVSTIYFLVLEYYPYSENEEHFEKISAIANLCVNVAYSLVYDSLIYLKNYENAEYGLLILKYIYIKAKIPALRGLKKNVIKTFDELEMTLQRPERPDLKNALEIVQIFRRYLKLDGLVFPPLPEPLFAIVKENRKR